MKWLDRILGRAPKFDVAPPKGDGRLHAVPTVRDARGAVKAYQEYFVSDDGAWSARVYGPGVVLENSGVASDRRAAAVNALAWCEQAKVTIARAKP